MHGDELNGSLSSSEVVRKPDVQGTWRERTDVVNKLAANLTSRVHSIARVTKPVALGDLSMQI